MLGWFRKGPVVTQCTEDDTTYTEIEQCPKIPPGGQCYFDPFDLELRKKALSVMTKYTSGLVPPPVPHTPESVVPEAGEDSPAEEWEQPADPSSEPMSPAPTNDAELKATIARERGLVEEMMQKLERTYPPDPEERYKLELSLLRFIRARKGDVAKACDMFVAMEKWRAEGNIDQLLDAPDSQEHAFQSICGHRNHGYGFRGQPVYFERTGLVRVANLLKVMEEDHIVLRHVRHMEYTRRRMEYSSYVNQCNIEKCILVSDLAHLAYTVETSGVRIFKKTLVIDQNYYPEMLHKMFIINAPLSFRGVWALVQPFIDPVTSRKIEILGAKYHDRLKLEIPLQELPSIYGGMCKCKYENGDSCLPHVRAYPAENTAEIPPAWPLFR